MRSLGDLKTVLSIGRNAYELPFIQKLIVNLIQMIVDKVTALSIYYLDQIQSDVIMLLIVFEGLVRFGWIGVLYSIGPEIYRHLNKQTVRVRIIMGNQNSQQENKAVKEYRSKTEESEKKVLKSPEEAFAIKCPQKLFKMYPSLMRKVQFVKNKENFSGVANVVEQCPVYYLKNLDCYYQGQWKDCLPHGCGIAVYRNQAYYQGDFNQGEIQTTQGLYFFNNGDDKIFQKKNLKNNRVQIQQVPQKVKGNKSSYYVGIFSKSKFHGKGKIFHKGIIYDGDWVQGKRQGEGREYTQDFSYSFQGKYVNGLKNERGIYTRKLKDKVFTYEGEFKGGKFNGMGKIQIDNYLHYNGSFVNGKIEGNGQLILEEGVFRGIFKNNLIKGQGYFQYVKSEKGTIQGFFQDKLDVQKKYRELFCNGTKVTKGVYYEFPLLIAEN